MTHEDIRIRDQGQTGVSTVIAAAMALEMALTHQSKPDPFLYASLSLMSTHHEPVPKAELKITHVNLWIEHGNPPTLTCDVLMTDKERATLQEIINRYCQEIRDRRFREERQGDDKEATS